MVEEIDRAFLAGASQIRHVSCVEDSQLPNEVDVLLDMEYETLQRTGRGDR